ncbi:MAG: hypothetical protein N2316_00875 [Spirochaetes bacterium]|nr:hypothetical protein [Spirochaetota bacterium]
MKKIDTTYVMRTDVIEFLLNAQEKTCVCKEVLIIRAIQHMLKNHKKYLSNEGRIKYQDRINKQTGLPISKKRVKVRFLQKEYNYFQDMRKFFGRSISLIIAIAVFEYLENVVKMILRNKLNPFEDNYPYHGYAWVEKRIENITYFKIWWGIPENLELLVT